MIGETISAISYEVERWASIAGMANYASSFCAALAARAEVQGRHQKGQGRKQEVKDPIDESCKCKQTRE